VSTPCSTTDRRSSRMPDCRAATRSFRRCWSARWTCSPLSLRWRSSTA
jgi:Sugar (and other) transporter.